MATARILLAGGGTDTETALRSALEPGPDDLEVVHTQSVDDALMALVAERFQMCVVRATDEHPEFAMELCESAKEAGVRMPIIVLMDISNAARERELLAAGALAAMPWDGSQDAMLRNFVNLTVGLRKSEENLRQSNDRLVMEMRTLQDERERAEAANAEYVAMAEELAIAKDELEKLNLEKTKFFSIIAHDLRSPFTALLGFSSLLVERAEKLEPAKVKQFATHIHQAGERVFKLLENLLEWSRLQMDRVDAQPRTFPLADVAGKTVEVLGPVAESKGVKLIERGAAPAPYADPNMVDAVIRNLVNNAIKFTPQGGTIAIVYETDEDRGLAWVSVMDTGVGMDADTAAKLFNIAENVTTEGTAGEKGTGLGLLLCKELVERNGGRIAVESTPGTGSTFSFTLPLNPPGGASATPPRAATG